MTSPIQKPIIYLSGIFFTCLLSACNHGGNVEQTPVPEVKKINAGNILDAAAVSQLAFMRTTFDLNNVAVTGFQLLIDQKTVGNHPCTGGGTITLEKSGNDNIFTPVNCNNGGLKLISGSFTINLQIDQMYNFKDVSYSTEEDFTAQTLSGQIKSSIEINASSASGTFIFQRNKRNDVYTDYITSSPHTSDPHQKSSMTINTPRFAHQLKTNYDISSNVIVNTASADDGSSVTMTLSKDGQGKLELRNLASGAITFSKSITNNELAAALIRAKE